MAIERKFINEAVKKAKIDLYVHEELQRVGCGEIEVKRTPFGTRIMIHAIKPGLVIGRKGKNIETLTETLKTKFKIENPQIEVQEVDVPEFDPEIMVKNLASTLERGIHFRRAAYSLLQRIMSAGALGAQIEISGKISGARARHEKFKQGYIKHCGETAKLYVKEATTQAYLRPGVVGIKIKVTPPTKEGLFNELSIVEVAEKIAEKVEESKEAQAGVGKSLPEKPVEAKPEEKKEEKPKTETKKVKKKAKKTKKPAKKAVKKTKAKKVKKNASTKKK